jgi:ribosomal protein L16/L10AE
MGKGKGSFDHWACRVAVNQILFEIRGLLHEQVIRDAFRLAGNKLPGNEPPLGRSCAAFMLTTVQDNTSL